MSQVCIFFAPGLEEIEGLTVVDLMRRAGISIQVVSVAGQIRWSYLRCTDDLRSSGIFRRPEGHQLSGI